MLLDNFRQKYSFIPYMNTGTLLDLLTGKYIQGVDGKYILDGGLPPCMGLVGRGQTYKSGLAGTFLARALINHPAAEAVVYETENNINGPTRYDDFLSRGDTVSNRILFLSATDLTLTDFYDQFIKIVEEKLKNKKDYLVESPFKDRDTGKKLKVWIPTFVLVDSFSKSKATKSVSQIEDTSIDSSELNQSWMVDGNIKTRIMQDLPTRASKAGVYVIMTAHVGNKIDMAAYGGGAPKQLQYMSFNDRIKNVGSNFEFLTNVLIQTISAEVLQDKVKDKDGKTKKGGCMYPTSFSTDVEVNQVTTVLTRCKNNASGITLPFIVSQYQGVLDAVTNFHFLRKNNNFGLDEKRPEGGKGKFAYSPYLYPTDLTTLNIRQVTEEDYKISRALELTAQLCFIQKLWSTWNLPEYISVKPKAFAEWLYTCPAATQDRILTSTGVWTTSKQERERLTLMDILEMMSNGKSK